jgi:hypothetical protein
VRFAASRDRREASRDKSLGRAGSFRDQRFAPARIVDDFQLILREGGVCGLARELRVLCQESARERVLRRHRFANKLTEVRGDFVEREVSLVSVDREALLDDVPHRIDALRDDLMDGLRICEQMSRQCLLERRRVVVVDEDVPASEQLVEDDAEGVDINPPVELHSLPFPGSAEDVPHLLR